MTNANYDRVTPYHLSFISPGGHIGECCYKENATYRAALFDYMAEGWQIIDTMRGYRPDWAVTVLYKADAGRKWADGGA